MTGKSFYNINTVYMCTGEITAGHLYILYKMSGGIQDWVNSARNQWTDAVWMFLTGVSRNVKS